MRARTIHPNFGVFSRILPNFPYNSPGRKFPGKIMNDAILTIREVAELLKINEKTAYKLAAERKIPGFKVGGSWRFRTEDIEKWIEAELRREVR